MAETESKKPSELEQKTMDAAFNRGQFDAQRGYPPREGGTPYLEGYAEKYDEMFRRKK